MQTEYAARILKLRLPEQNALKNTPERCSADPVKLETIGRSVGEQVRIKRKDDPRFFALYTIKQANPDADLRDHRRTDVVRAGQAGRERLGTSAAIEATVQANVVDAVPQPAEPDGTKFFEIADDDEKQSYFVAIAPHGGEIEEHTDEEAAETVRQLTEAGFPGSLWLCKGFGDAAKGAFDRWHITSTDLNPASFPLLQALMSRPFCYAVAFHGFHRRHNEADVYIGGAASRSLKATIKVALNDLDLPIKVKISTRHDSPKFQGFSAENITNRLATRGGIHLEQSAQARKYHLEIARAVAHAFVSQLRFLFCVFVQALETERIKRKAEFVQALSSGLAAAPLNVERAIDDYKVWKATDDVLAARVQTAEEPQSFGELEKPPLTGSRKKKG
ncbi:MAG TPA: poly-gamma-glutamate hydrolase family protein [Verrucomicrobiae bacterium]|nr:poly-gamma-glutamate hydrolase family protein [Verrucomicrobiae bacterium]